MMNLFQAWEKKHFRSIISELDTAGIELTVENIPRIVEETSFGVRSEKHPDECLYYPTGVSCIPSIKDLNCLLCACPQYQTESLKGGCKIYSKFGKVIYHENLPEGQVWDCSACPTYHTPGAVEQFLRKNIDHIFLKAEAAQNSSLPLNL